MTDNLLQQEQQDDLPAVDMNKNYLNELVGDGKKFKSPEELARGKYESDQYIEILKKRQDELRQDYLKIREENTTRAQLKDLIDQMKQQQLASSEHTPANEDRKPTFDPSQIESLVSAKIQEHDASRKQQENYNLVKDKLQQRYGTKYKDVVKQQIDDLGLTETELNEMARKQPKVLIKTLGLDQEPQTDTFQSPPRSVQRRDNFAPTGGQKRTWTYYQDLKNKDPKAWLDRRIAVQMQQDALELGDAFKDGDYFKSGLHEQ